MARTQNQAENTKSGRQAPKVPPKLTTGAAAPKAPPQASPDSAETGESNDVYGVVSVLYHALQGAETYGKYIEDARKSGDGELEEFFRECQIEERERADRAKSLLASRIQADADEDEEEDDEDEDEDDDQDEDEDEDEET
jgi:hypothetical protein